MESLGKSCLNLVLALLVIVALGETVTARAAGGTRLRVVHASSDSPAADVYVDGELLFQNIPFTTVSNYIPRNPGNHTLRIMRAGDNPGNQPVIEATLSFGENKDYTIVVVGKLAQLELLQLEDINTPPESGKSRVRLVHISPNAGGIDVCVVGQQGCFINNLNYKGNAIANLNAGVYNIDIHQSGNNNPLLNIPNAKFGTGVYSLFLVGSIDNNPPLRVITALDANNTSPNRPPISGAFLSPEALAVASGVLMMLALGSFIFVKKSRYSF